MTLKLAQMATTDQAKKLESIGQRCKDHDLLKMFQQYFYTLGMHGWSIKEIARCLLPNNPYDTLSTANGVQAMVGYEDFLLMPPSPEREQLRQDLLTYCKVDTQVMIDIWRAVLQLGVCGHA